MSVGQPFANITQFTLRISARTLTPHGAIVINDARQRQPPAGYTYTLAGTINGQNYDLYAQQDTGNTYILLALPLGTDVSNRRDLVYVGRLVEFSAQNSCAWIPQQGATLDTYIMVDDYGVHLVPMASETLPLPYAKLALDPPPSSTNQAAVFLQAGQHEAIFQSYIPFVTDTNTKFQDMAIVSNGMTTIQARSLMQLLAYDIMLKGTNTTTITTNATNAQSAIWDAYGRERRTQAIPPSVSVNVATAGSGASAQVFGTDSYGRVELQTGTGTSGGSNPLFTVTYANPHVTRPYGVSIAPANANSLGMSNNQIVGVPYSATAVANDKFVAYVGQQALSVNTPYIFNYVVLIA